MKTKVKIYIVDDNKQFIDGLKLLLAWQDSNEVIGVANNGKELLDKNDFGLADIILLDIEMPDMGGFEVAKRINWIYPKIKLIAITMYMDKIYLEKLVNVGFKGFVNKTEITEKLIQVIGAVNDGKLSFPDNINLRKD